MMNWRNSIRPLVQQLQRTVRNNDDRFCCQRQMLVRSSCSRNYYCGATSTMEHYNNYSRSTPAIRSITNTNTGFSGLRSSDANIAMINKIIGAKRTLVMVSQTKAANDIDSIVEKEAVENNSGIKESTNMEQQEQTVIVTDSCWKRIDGLCSKKDDNDLYLRVFVDAGGCSGFTYQFELENIALYESAEDIVFRRDADAAADAVPRQCVIIDQTSLKLLAGSTIDYVQEMIKSSFEVRANPQSESACGCGSSFAVKNFTSNPALD